jgi:cardiolipin synthase
MIIPVMIVSHLLGLMLSIDAVMKGRTSQGAIAWAVSLNTFPYIAVPAYLVLGRRNFQGYVTMRQSEDMRIREVAKLAEQKVTGFIVPEGECTPGVRTVAALAKIPVLKGNDAEVLVDGVATFGDIFKGIEKARDYVLVQFYIVRDDKLGRELKSNLIAMAKQGVRVYFLYDDIGSLGLPEAYKRELRSAGVEVRNFHSRKGFGNRFQINFRNHRKIVVVDGQVAWVGGHNVGDEYLGNDPDFGHWRDTHVRIEGPAALAVQLSFLEDWHWAADGTIELKWVPEPAVDGNMKVLIAPTGPADTLETAALMHLAAINSASERIWIASPYFVPDEDIIKALQLAGLRGVDVRIIIPDKADSMLVSLAAYSYFNEISSTGAKFYRYLKGFPHQKILLVDEEISTIGTANFDNRSFRLNFEITALFVDPGLASEVEKMLLTDLANSRPMEPDEYDKRSFWFKLAVRLARLSSPVL